MNNPIFDQLEYNKRNTDFEKMIYVASCIIAVDKDIQNLTVYSQALKNNKINEKLLSLQEKNEILENEITNIKNDNKKLAEELNRNEQLREILIQLNDDIENVHITYSKIEAEIALKKAKLEEINSKMAASKSILDKLATEYESAVMAHSQHVDCNKSILNVIGSTTELDYLMKDISGKLNVLDNAIKTMREERKKKPISEIVLQKSGINV